MIKKTIKRFNNRILSSDDNIDLFIPLGFGQALFGYFLTYEILEYSKIFAEIFFLIPTILLIFSLYCIGLKYKIYASIASGITLLIIFGIYTILFMV